MPDYPTTDAGRFYEFSPERVMRRQSPSCLRTILSQSDVIRNMNIEIGQGCCDGSK
jgi:hypothetical protein